jgi:hypothetical protein
MMRIGCSATGACALINVSIPKVAANIVRIKRMGGSLAFVGCAELLSVLTGEESCRMIDK